MLRLPKNRVFCLAAPKPRHIPRLAFSTEKDDKVQFHKWSVVPQLRGRSATTNRLWINRYEELSSSKPTEPIEYKPIAKRMKESYVEEYLPFKSDLHVKEEYIDIYGKIRVGKLFEDLDALAGSIAYTHADDGVSATPPLTIVTACVDKIDLMKSAIPSDEDLRLSGFVSYVGSSSMEISICVETVPEGVDEAIKTSSERRESLDRLDPANQANNSNLLIKAKFTMVARDPISGKAARVNSLRLDTEIERKLYRLGAEHKAKKQVEIQTALTRLPPSVEEMFLIHRLYMEQASYTSARNVPGDVVAMSETEQKVLVMCMPQDRNIHNNIFGGYLMRKAYELSHATGILFSGGPISFLKSEDIIFKQPVPIGSLLSLNAKVVYVTGDVFYVLVVADVMDPYVQSKSRTNEFYFAFRGEGLKKRVIAESYEESMNLISGRRLSLQ